MIKITCVYFYVYHIPDRNFEDSTVVKDHSLTKPILGILMLYIAIIVSQTSRTDLVGWNRQEFIDYSPQWNLFLMLGTME